MRVIVAPERILLIAPSITRHDANGRDYKSVDPWNAVNAPGPTAESIENQWSSERGCVAICLC